MKTLNPLRLIKMKNGYRIWLATQILVALFGGVIFAYGRLSSGLWLDETLTAWIIRDDILSAFNRSLHYQGQSPLYYSLIYFWTKLFGISEIGIRSFSVLAFGISIILLYLICRIRYSAEISICGAIVSGTLLLLYVPVLDARPYGMAWALLIGSYYYLFVFLESGSSRARIVNIACLVMSIYAHWMYGTVLVAQTIMVLIVETMDKRQLLRQWVANLLIVAALCSPNAYQIFLIFEKRYVYNYLGEAKFLELAAITFPIFAILLCILPLLILIISKRISYLNRSGNLFFFALIWMIIPPTLLYFISLFGVSVLSSRYSGNICGMGIMIASLIACISAVSKRRVVCAFSIIMAVFWLYAIPYGVESWREPIAILKTLEDTDARPVLIYTGLIEMDSKKWMRDISKRDYLLAPMMYYLPSCNPIIVPGPMNIDLLEETLKSEMGELGGSGFYLIARKILYKSKNDEVDFSTELFKRYFGGKKFIVIFEKNISGISLIKFDPVEKAQGDKEINFFLKPGS